MGEIIAFKQDARREKKADDRSDSGAEILFFLGVRYMRMDDDMAEKLSRQAEETHDRPGGGGKRKRRARA